MSDTALPLAKPQIATLRAAANLGAARLAVRLLPFSFLRMSLGGNRSAPLRSEIERGNSDRELAVARYWAGRVERAALRLPGESRCLPKAAALFWMLRRRQIEARLVIAIHRSERRGAHAYHAWLEHAGAMIVGACERSEYREIMAFQTLPQTSSAPVARSA